LGAVERAATLLELDHHSSQGVTDMKSMKIRKAGSIRLTACCCYGCCCCQIAN
jgi:hypothetical protein